MNPGSISISQTFQETNFPVKTLQENNLIAESMVQKRSIASFDFTYYLSDNASDDAEIWEWFGFTRSNNTFSISPIVTAEPLQKNFYVKTSHGKHIKVNNAVIEAISVELRHNQISKINVSGSATLVEVIDNSDSIGSISKSGNFLGNNAITVVVGSEEQAHLINNSISLRRSIEWLDQPTLHSSGAGELYTPSIPYQTDLSIAGRFTKLLSDNNLAVYKDNIKITSGPLEVYLDSASITERLDIAAVFGKTLDFKVLSDSNNNYIRYN